MQDRTGDVFVVATANDISRLPAEFLRKGRFDEIFFVDLPDATTRAEIFQIHIENRGKESGSFDLEALSAATPGFSGSEIEGVVVSSLYSAFFRRRHDHDRIPAEGGRRNRAPFRDPSRVRRRVTRVGQGASQAGQLRGLSKTWGERTAFSPRKPARCTRARRSPES